MADKKQFSEPPPIGGGTPPPGGGPVQCCTFPGCTAQLVNGRCPHGHAQDVVVEPGLNWSPLPDAEIEEIHDGLLVPNEQSIRRMALEIRKWRGAPDPDAA